MTTGLRATAIEELCHTLGLRTPIGVVASLQHPEAIPEKRGDAASFTDEQLTALGVLAQPEAIAVVTNWPPPQPFAPAVPVVHVIATRGPWLAEHVIEGDAHHLHAADVENAAILLLDRSRLVSDDASVPAVEPVNVTLGAYLRMNELVRAGDYRRGMAALVADGAASATANALVEAISAGRTEVAGLGGDGRRFVGCDLAYAGDSTTGRWLVPATQHVDSLPRRAFRHPSFAASGNLRVLVEPVDAEALREELNLIFGPA